MGTRKIRKPSQGPTGGRERRPQSGLRCSDGVTGGVLKGLNRRADGAVVVDATPTLAGEAVGAKDGETPEALHAGEDGAALGVVRAGVLHVLLDDVGAVGAGDWEV